MSTAFIHPLKFLLLYVYQFLVNENGFLVSIQPPKFLLF